MTEQEMKIEKYKAKRRSLIIKKLAIPIAVVILAIAVIISAIVSLSSKKTDAITASSVITEKKNYSMEKLFCETLSDKAVEDGWKYYYIETADNGATLKDWISPEGEVAVELSVNITNLSKEAVDFSSKASCKLVYSDGTETATAVMQENPEQKAENGEKCRSTVILPINPEQTAKLWFMADIPTEIRDSDLPLKAIITIDKNTYTVDLRENMKIFSE